MKTRSIKYLIIFSCVAFILSCSKKTNWNCSCTVPAAYNPNGTAPVYTTTIDNASKANGKDLCNKYGGQKMPANSYTCTITEQ